MTAGGPVRAAKGPGKYDEALTAAIASVGGFTGTTVGELWVLIAINGRLGTGFDVQTNHPAMLRAIPGLLREMADGIEKEQLG